MCLKEQQQIHKRQVARNEMGLEWRRESTSLGIPKHYIPLGIESISYWYHVYATFKLSISLTNMEQVYPVKAAH